MLNTIGLGYIILIAISIVLLFSYIKTGKLFRCIFFTGFSGVGCLGVVWIVSQFTQLVVAITPFTILLSGILGIPGVICMLMFNLI